jgi:hypothetical protein
MKITNTVRKFGTGVPSQRASNASIDQGGGKRRGAAKA